MAHFYLAMNRLLTGEFEIALADCARADVVGKEIGDPRLQTYAGFTIGWIETLRGSAAVAVEICRRSLEQAPDRVSRAYASMFLGFAQVEHGEHAQALERLRPLVAELESFGIPQFHALANILVGEAERLHGRLEEAAAAACHGIEIASQCQYWYGVGVGERIAGRIARDFGQEENARAAFDRSVRVFESIGACFEADRTKREMDR